VARRFGDQRERDEAEVALRQHASGAQVVGTHTATHAVASTTETKGAEATAAMAPGTPFFAARFTISISMHFRSPSS
jgi:hypothetical protein